MTDIEVLTEKFETTDVKFIIDETGEVYIPPIVVATALDYSHPKKAVNNILERNTEHFKDKIKRFPMSHGGTPEIVLTEEGLYLFLMFSQQPKAKEFKVWAAEQLKKHRVITSKLTDPLDQVIETAQLIIHVATQQKQQQANIQALEEQQAVLEQQQQMLIEELVNITKPQKHHIQSKVRELVILAKERNPEFSDRKLYPAIYGVLRDWFKIPRYDELPRERYDEALELLDCLQQLISMNLINFNEYLSVRAIERLCNTYRRDNT